VYVDFDDTVIIRCAVNTELVKALYHFINQGKTLHLVTKHIYDIQETLLKYRLQGLFDEVILLNKTDQKYLHIDPADSIYIDDSFAERNEVKEKLGIPVFSPDMVEVLI
jgi:hypothetical protein